MSCLNTKYTLPHTNMSRSRYEYTHMHTYIHTYGQFATIHTCNHMYSCLPWYACTHLTPYTTTPKVHSVTLTGTTIKARMELGVMAMKTYSTLS